MNGEHFVTDWTTVHGQAHVARALEVAAAGGYSILLTGSAGVGKAYLARTLPTLLGTTSLYEPQPEDENIVDRGPLFIRDLHEWDILTLKRVMRLDSASTMIATAQTCPCGFYGDPVIECLCSVEAITSYTRRYAPFLYDFDMHIEVPRPSAGEMLDTRQRESSQNIRDRVEKARNFQGARPRATTLIEGQQDLEDAARRLLKAAIQQMHLSPQKVLRFLCIARTIADLEQHPTIPANAIAEAIQYRSRTA